MTQPFSGWGNGGWGTEPWGSPITTVFAVVSVFAQAENVVRVELNYPLYYSGILDGADGSNPARWQLTPAAGSPTGWDGNLPRPIAVVSTAQPNIAGAQVGTYVDLTLDRPMTPYPSQYVLSVNGLYTADKSQTLTGGVATPFNGVYAALQPPSVESSVPGRDFSNPQTLSQATGSTVNNPSQAVLGSFNYSNGDYALDSRDAGLLKRLNRRTFTKPNGFYFLPGYGIGVAQYGKKLARSSTRAELAAACEAQYGQEPEVANVTVVVVPSPTRPNLMRLQVGIQKKDGKSIRYSTNLPIT